MSVMRGITNSAAFRAATRRGPGAALLRSGAFRRSNAARRRAAAEQAAARDPGRFAQVRTFCFFIGHMKSGTSLLGSLLDAHADVIIADEVDALRRIAEGYERDPLFHLLARGAEAEAEKGRVTARRLDGGYALAVGGQSQGRSEHPLVVGDGRAGPSTQRLADDPAVLARLREVLGVVDLRVIHVIRNPFDPIALSVIRGGRTLEDATLHYFARCEALERTRALFGTGEVLPVRYEDLVADPRAWLMRACDHLGIEAGSDWLDACCGFVHPQPERSRDQIAWPASAIADVQARITAFAFLAGYEFEQEVRT